MTKALAVSISEAPVRPRWFWRRRRCRCDRAVNTIMTAARTDGTRRVYSLVWGQWQRWCTERGMVAMPADPLAVCAYLSERAEAGRATGTLDMACTVIRHVHRTCNAVDPIASEAVRQVRRGLRRTYGAAPRRLARPLSVEEIRQIIAGIDRSTPHGIRDAAIILLGYASAMRRAELVALDLADVEPKPAGLLLHIRQSKTDQEGDGHRLMKTWCSLRGTGLAVRPRP